MVRDPFRLMYVLLVFTCEIVVCWYIRCGLCRGIFVGGYTLQCCLSLHFVFTCEVVVCWYIRCGLCRGISVGGYYTLQNADNIPRLLCVLTAGSSGGPPGLIQASLDLVCVFFSCPLSSFHVELLTGPFAANGRFGNSYHGVDSTTVFLPSTFLCHCDSVCVSVLMKSF